MNCFHSVDEIRKYIDECKNENSNIKYNHILIDAAKIGNYEMVELLINEGANVN